MGLDMYLSKVKKYGDASLEEIVMTSRYIDYINNESAKGCSFNDWCGGKDELVRKDLVDEMQKDFTTQYYAWDTEHEYGHSDIVADLGYWRKANQIHRWFVENVQDGTDDCGEYEVSKEQLEELLDICREVLAASELVDGKIQNGWRIKNGVEEPIIEDGKTIADPSVAESLLPTSSGFFFGGTNYDEYYYSDIEHTIEVLESTLRDTDFEHEIVFYSSSW